MYESHFGFHRQPFQSAELARAFFVSGSIREILPQLLHALRSDLGIAVLTGPSGVGKTSLLKHIRSLLANEGRTVICSGASLETPAEVIAALYTASLQQAGEKAIHDMSAESHTRTRWATVDQLRKTTEFWGPILLLVDDAQLLSVPVLNELRAFTEEEWNGKRLVRCLVSGPLSLEEELARPTHSDFSRRIRCHAFLQPLTSRESIEFLSRHLEAVGGKPSRVFSAEALEYLVSACDGLPRCLSLLADESLIVTAELSKKSADLECVRKALSRLQHLPYSWNVSLWPCDETDADQSVHIASVATATAAAATHTTTAAGSIEFGAPGIIEIGGPRTVNTVATTIPLQNTTPTVTSSTSTPGPTSAKPDVQAHSVAFFEVGHRFERQNQAEYPFTNNFQNFPSSPINELDLFSHEDIEPCVDVDDVEAVSQLLDNSVSDSPYADLIVADTPVRREDLISNHVTNTPESDSSVHSAPRVQFLGGDPQNELAFDMSQSDASDRRVNSSGGERFANRLPVFDRYTWIALGREVPSGTFSVASASKMQQLNNGMLSRSDISIAGDVAIAGSLSFDRIPIIRTSDYEIISSLTRSANAAEDGTFVLFNSTPAIPANWTDVYPTDRPLASVFGGVTVPPVVGVEHFNAAETAASETSFENHGFDRHDAEDESVVSDTNRLLIREAIRSSLAHVIKVPGSSEHAELSGSLPQEVESILEALLLPKGNGHESLWHDGQLVFGHKPTEVFAAKDESTTADDDVPLSFDAARIARDELNQIPPESISQKPKAETFFTLPVEVKSIEWDLRSELVDLDEVFPLAESLAALRVEVSTFQQFGLSNDTASSKGMSLNVPTTQAPESTVPVDSLVSLAKRRLEETDFAGGTITQQSTGLLSASSRIDEPLTARHQESTAVAEETVNAVAPASRVVPKFSQLFTRLQAMRRQSGEK